VGQGPAWIVVPGSEMSDTNKKYIEDPQMLGSNLQDIFFQEELAPWICTPLPRYGFVSYFYEAFLL